MENRPWGVHVLLCLFLAAAATLWSCGEEHPEKEPADAESSALFRFSLQAGQSAPILTLSQLVDGKKSFIEVVNDGQGGFTGTFEPDSGRIVLDEGVVLIISSPDHWDEGGGDLTFTVEEGIEIVRDFPAFRTTFPRFGTFAVTDGHDIVRGTFAGITGERGVNLSVNGARWTFFREAAFAGLFGVDADVRQRKASLAFVVVNLLVRQIFFVARTIDIIHEHKQDLLDDETITFTCSDLSFSPGPFPETGTRIITWFDADGDDRVGAGDSFRWDLFSCLEDEEADLVEGLVSGRVDLAGMVDIRVERGGRDVVVRFGFDQGGGSGVRFTDFAITEMQDESQPLVTDGSRTFTLNGEFSLVFSENNSD